MKYIDIHTHVNLAAFDEDYREVIGRAQEAGVAMINVGTQIDTARKAVALAEEYEEGVYAIVGVHPIHTSKAYHDEKELGKEHADGKGFISRGELFDADAYRAFFNNPKVVGVGECGLDYYRVSEGRGSIKATSKDVHMTERTKGESSAYYRVELDTIDRQRESFIAQIKFANELQKPLMLHVRPSDDKNAPSAYKDAYEIIKKHANVPGNVHFFAGSVEDGKRFWDIGYSTSFTGVITFTNDYDEQVKAAPKELIHAETDAPYVAPVPHRGKRNEPAYVVEVVKRMAELRGMEVDEWAAQLRENAKNFFGV